jgi:heme exporter protein C
VYLSVVWWRTLHQPPSSPRSVSPDILFALLLNLAAFSLVYVYFMVRRARLAAADEKLEEAMAHHG